MRVASPRGLPSGFAWFEHISCAFRFWGIIIYARMRSSEVVRGGGDGSCARSCEAWVRVVVFSLLEYNALLV